MTPDDLKAARESLGLTQSGLAEALGMGKDGRHIRKLEAGKHPISGPVEVAVTLMCWLQELSKHYGFTLAKPPSRM